MTAQILLEVPREAIEQIAREVVEESLLTIIKKPAFQDAEAEATARKLQRINAKQNITIPEFCFLFNCSPSYVGKLLERAQADGTSHPVPYLNLDGLIQFDRVAVLEWAAMSKPLAKRVRKTGGRKGSSVLHEVAKRA